MIFTMPPVEVAGILAWILADLCREYWVGSGGGRALDIDVDPGSTSTSRLGKESGGVADGSGERDLDTQKKEGEEQDGCGEGGLDSTLVKSFFEEGVWEQELELGQANIGSNADRPSPSSSTPLLDTLNPSFSQSSSVPSIPTSASALTNSALSPSSSSNPNINTSANANPQQQQQPQQENRQQQQQQYPPQNPPPLRHNPHRTPIPVLGQVTLSDLGRLEEETKKGNGWIACTTDAIFLERPECYDLVVDLSSMKGCFGLDYTCGGKGRGGKAGEGGGSRLSGLGGVGVGGGGGGGGREDSGSGSGGGGGGGRGSRVGLYMSKPKFTGGEGAAGVGRKKKSWKLESVRFTFSDVKLVCVPLSLYISLFSHSWILYVICVITDYFLSVRLIYSGQNWTGYSNSIRRFLLIFRITITIIVTLTTTIIIIIITATNIVTRKVQ